MKTEHKLNLGVLTLWWFAVFAQALPLLLWGEVDDAKSSVAGKKVADQVADGEKKEDAPAPQESKSSKKKKSKKDKSSKESKEGQDQGNDGSEDAAGAEPDEDTASVDVKERIKKVASMKKKKSSKEMDAAAKIAASEAAARNARLAAAKKKEKSHYNQQPLRWTALILDL